MAVSGRPAPPAAEAPAEDETAKAPNWLKGEEIMATFALIAEDEVRIPPKGSTKTMFSLELEI
jgi:hypothetical protein